jgi:hypothetical protein
MADCEETMSRSVVFGGTLVVASLLLTNIGFAEEASPIHNWPIHDGHNYQPTQHELRALHLENVTPDQAREVDRLYDQLLSASEAARNRIGRP